jgi:hypothetical protein
MREKSEEQKSPLAAAKRAGTSGDRDSDPLRHAPARADNIDECCGSAERVHRDG